MMNHKSIQFYSHIRFHSARFYNANEHIINLFMLAIISAIIFSNSLFSYFLAVDDLHVYPQTLRDAASLFVRNTYYGGGDGSNYRPIEVLSFMFDIYFYGEDNPFGRRLTNVIIHICNVILVYGIAFRLTRIKGIGLLAGLIFATHLVHSQSAPPVAWIAGRPDLFVTLFYLTAVYLFVEFGKKRVLLLYIGSLVAFGFALLSKEMAITLPLLIILYVITDPWNAFKGGGVQLYETNPSRKFRIILFGGVILFILGLILNQGTIERFWSPDGVLEIDTLKIIHLFQVITLGGGFLTVVYSLLIMFYRNNTGKLYQCVKYGMPYFIISTIFLFTRFIILGRVGGNYKSETGNLSLQFGIDTLIRDIFSFAGLIWPVGADYNLDVFNLQIDHTHTFYIGGIIAAILLIIILYGCLMYSRTLVFSYSWIFLTLIPAHNILIPSSQFMSRYLYLPSVGFSMFVSILLYRWGALNSRIWNRGKILVVGSIILFVIINIILIRENNEKLYHSGEITRELVTLFKSTPANNSESINLIFLTFPLSSTDTLNAVWITMSMPNLMYYAVRPWEQRKKYRPQVILFTNHGENGEVNISNPEDGVFILDAIGDGSFFLIPKDRSLAEKKIKAIYHLLPGEVMLKPIPSEGGYEETNNARIKVLALDKRANRVTLKVELKELSHGSGKSYFYIFDQGHFKLLPIKA